MDPVDEFLEESPGQIKIAEGLRLWHEWKAEPNKTTLRPLLDHFKSDFDKKLHLFKAPNVSAAALRSAMIGHAIKAFEDYDPSRGASLSTHVNNRLARAQRDNLQNQNMAVIPEEIAGAITAVNLAKGNLRDQFERDPTHKEIASYLKKNPEMIGNKRTRTRISPTFIKRVEDYAIRDISSAKFETDPNQGRLPAFEETVGLLVNDPNIIPEGSQERLVANHLFGLNGVEQEQRTSVIANRLGIQPSQVSRLRGRIEKKLKNYL